MANKELVNYIKEQIKLGINVDVLKQTILDSGWTNKDIEEAFEEINKEKEKTSEEIQKLPSQNIIDLKDKNLAPNQTQKFISPESFVSKLTPNVLATTPIDNSNLKPEPQTPKDNLKSTNNAPEPQQVKIVSALPNHKKFKIIIYILFGLLFAGLLGLVVFLYTQNNSLEKKLVVSNSQQGDLEGQVQSLTKTINDLQKEVASLKEDNNNLLNEKNDLLNQVLLFSFSTSSLEIEFNATPIKENNQYLLKTSQNILVSIKNQTDIVKKILDKFLNTTIKISGMRVPGRREITITEINKESLEKWQEEIINQPTTNQTSTISSQESNSSDKSQVKSSFLESTTTQTTTSP